MGSGREQICTRLVEGLDGVSDVRLFFKRSLAGLVAILFLPETNQVRVIRDSKIRGCGEEPGVNGAHCGGVRRDRLVLVVNGNR